MNIRQSLRGSDYDVQRWICRQAKEHGWKGEEPSVLGGYHANLAVADAEQFLESLPEPCRAIVEEFTSLVSHEN